MTPYFNFSIKYDPVLHVSGYDYYGRFQLYGMQNKAQPASQTFTTPQGDVIFNYDSTTGAIQVHFREQTVVLTGLTAGWLKDMRERHGLNGYNLPPEELTFKGEAGSLRVLLQITNLNGQLSDDDATLPRLDSINGDLLFAVE